MDAGAVAGDVSAGPNSLWGDFWEKSIGSFPIERRREERPEAARGEGMVMNESRLYASVMTAMIT